MSDTKQNNESISDNSSSLKDVLRSASTEA